MNIEKSSYSIQDLLEIVEYLRSDKGCPWDQKQTHQSVRKNMLEEAYEVCDAIDKQDSELLKEELGDVLMQVVFHSQMEKEAGGFTFNDVCDGVCKKLVQRHPHVFGNAEAKDHEEALKNWDAIKRSVKGQQTYTQSLEDLPKALPAAMRTHKLLERAKRGGFCLDSRDALISELEENLQTLKMKSSAENIEAEKRTLGKMLFCCVAMLNHMQAESEEVLNEVNDHFIKIFKKVENEVLNQHIKPVNISPEKWRILWERMTNVQ